MMLFPIFVFAAAVAAPHPPAPSPNFDPARSSKFDPAAPKMKLAAYEDPLPAGKAPPPGRNGISLDDRDCSVATFGEARVAADRLAEKAREIAELERKVHEQAQIRDNSAAQAKTLKAALDELDATWQEENTAFQKTTVGAGQDPLRSAGVQRRCVAPVSSAGA